MKITLAGDIVSNFDYSLSITIDPGLFIYNLEAPYISKESKVRIKAGPHIQSDKEFIPNIMDCQFVANLANNHIFDYGWTGLENTLKICQENGIETVGANNNLQNAQMTKIIERDNERIGIIGACEKQFGCATFSTPGVSCIGPWIYSEIRKLKQCCDLVVISIHGAAELSPWPSPDWQDFLRSLIDTGADVIHGHHSHVPQGYEKYRNGYIFYGLGNFIVNPKCWINTENALWSIMPILSHDNGQIESFQIDTSVIDQIDPNGEIIIRRSNIKERGQHEEYLEHANIPLSNKELLTGYWQETSIRMFFLWFSKWLDMNPSAREINWSDILIRNFVDIKRMLKNQLGNTTNQNKCLFWYHLFACESHRNSISTALGVIGGEIDDVRNDHTSQLVDKMMPWSRKWKDRC